MAENFEKNHLKIGELPHLKIVSGKKLLFHEEPDENRLLDLVDRLGAEGVLKNPPIVARYDTETNYIILDGANRITALTKLGFKHFPVQVIDYKDELLKLHCWNHVLEKLNKDNFLKNLSTISGFEMKKAPAESDEPLRKIGDKNILCHILFNDGQSFYLIGGDKITDRVTLLTKIARLYLDHAAIDRISYTTISHVEKHHPDFVALITYQRIEKTEFLKFVKAGQKLPAGITRVFLPKRALGLNIPLEFLKSDLTLAEKNRWLDDMIIRRVRNKSIRFYREPTFVFDE